MWLAVEEHSAVQVWRKPKPAVLNALALKVVRSLKKWRSKDNALTFASAVREAGWQDVSVDAG
jgi:hypothetical protein